MNAAANSSDVGSQRSTNGKDTHIKKGRGDRPKDLVINTRVAEMVSIISTKPNVHRCQLHALLCPRWKCHWKTVDRIVWRARAVMLERLNRSREDFQCEVLSAYEKELASDKPSVRLAALAGIRELLGLDAPRRHAIGGDPDAPPVFVVAVGEDELP